MVSTRGAKKRQINETTDKSTRRSKVQQPYDTYLERPVPKRRRTASPERRYGSCPPALCPPTQRKVTLNQPQPAKRHAPWNIKATSVAIEVPGTDGKVLMHFNGMSAKNAQKYYDKLFFGAKGTGVKMLKPRSMHNVDAPYNRAFQGTGQKLGGKSLHRHEFLNRLQAKHEEEKARLLQVYVNQYTAKKKENVYRNLSRRHTTQQKTWKNDVRHEAMLKVLKQKANEEKNKRRAAFKKVMSFVEI